MLWQDALISTGGFLLAAALLPAVFGGHRPPRSSAILTGTILGTYIIAFASLGLWWSVAGLGTQVACWAVIAWRGP